MMFLYYLGNAVLFISSAGFGTLLGFAVLRLIGVNKRGVSE